MQMAWYQIVLALVTIVTAVLITVLVLLQESKSQGLSGVISGGGENLFGRSKGRSFEDKLVKYTKYLTIGLYVLTLGTALLALFGS